jgi:hypothetical protein
LQAQLTACLARSSSGLAAEADVFACAHTSYPDASSSAIALPFGVPCAAALGERALGGVAGPAVAPPLAPTGGPLAALDDDANLVDLHTDAPNGAPPPPGYAKLPSTPSKTAVWSAGRRYAAAARR